MTFANQGDNNERDVRVHGDACAAVRQADHGRSKTRRPDDVEQTATVDIPLGQRRRSAQAVTVEVAVGKVPGEKNTDNNRQSYTVHLHAGEPPPLSFAAWTT